MFVIDCAKMSQQITYMDTSFLINLIYDLKMEVESPDKENKLAEGSLIDKRKQRPRKTISNITKKNSKVNIYRHDLP